MVMIQSGAKAFRAMLTVAIGTVLVVGSAQPAAADVSAEEMEAFQAHLERGSSLLDDEEFHAAIDELDQARQIIDHPRITVRIVEAFRNLDRCSKAESEYASLAAREDLSDEIIDELDQERARLDECVEHVDVVIECQPDSATVHLEGADIDDDFACPYTARLPVDTLVIRVEADGYEPVEEELSLQPGVDEALEYVLVPVEEDEEEDAVAVDDREDDAVAVDEQVQPPPADQVEPESPRWPTILGISAMGVGAAMVAGGGLIDYGARSRLTELAEARDDGDIERVENLQSSASDRQLIAGALYGGGAAFLVGGLVLNLIDFSSSPDDESGVSFRVNPTGISTLWRW